MAADFLGGDFSGEQEQDWRDGCGQLVEELHVREHVCAHVLSEPGNIVLRDHDTFTECIDNKKRKHRLQ